MRRGFAGPAQQGAAAGRGYHDGTIDRSHLGRSSLHFSVSRFRHNDRVALALLPALAVVAGSADVTVLWMLLVRDKLEEMNREREVETSPFDR